MNSTLASTMWSHFMWTRRPLQIVISRAANEQKSSEMSSPMLSRLPCPHSCRSLWTFSHVAETIHCDPNNWGEFWHCSIMSMTWVWIIRTAACCSADRSATADGQQRLWLDDPPNYGLSMMTMSNVGVVVKVAGFSVWVINIAYCRSGVSRQHMKGP